MNDPLAIGALFGAAIGVVHGGYVYRERASRQDGRRLVALYYAAWTLALWVLFGSYVLFLGLIAIPIFAIHRAVRWMNGSRGSVARWT